MNLILESQGFAVKDFPKQNDLILSQNAVHNLLCKICLLVDDSDVKCVSLLVWHSARLGVAAKRAHL